MILNLQQLQLLLPLLLLHLQHRTVHLLLLPRVRLALLHLRVHHSLNGTLPTEERVTLLHQLAAATDDLVVICQLQLH